MTATLASVKDGIARIRLDSALRMKHRFFPVKDDDNHVDAKVVGYVDCDLEKAVIKDLRLVTETGAYANDTFGISVRLHSLKDVGPRSQDATGSTRPMGTAIIGLTGVLAVVGMLVIARCKSVQC
jgi:hypothetical protein